MHIYQLHTKIGYQELENRLLANIGRFVLALIVWGATSLSESRGQSKTQKDIEIIPISELRLDQDGDGTADTLGDTVKVTGIANIATGLLHEVYLQVFIQSESAGISLFSDSFDQPINRGDSVVATGVVQQYFGMTEVNVIDYEVHENPGTLPDPVPLAVAVQNKPAYEGMLVGGTATVTGKGNRYNGKYLTISPSDTVSESMNLYVSNFHSLYQNFDFESLSSGDEINVTGVYSHYNPGKNEGNTYNVFLRLPGDLKTIGITQYSLMLVSIIGLIVTILAVGWIISLRSRVKSKTEKIQKALEEKELLLKEIHHRVKNNLAIISGLIELQMDSSLNDETQKVLMDSQSRIQSIALVHDKLYRTTTVTDIGMGTYIKELVESLKYSFTGPDSDIELRFDIDEVSLDIDRAIPCGLLINELVVNSFKHAFANQEGVLEVSLKKGNPRNVLTIADNGQGLPDNFREKMQSSLGLMLVETFKDQLGAEMKVENDNGARFTFTFPSSDTGE